MSTRAALGLIIILAAGLGAGEAGPPKLSREEQEKLVTTMNGVFDFSKGPWPYHALLILDQAGNPLPSFWCGRNQAGTPSIHTESDWLEGRIVVAQEGEYTVALTTAPIKPGMDAAIPGGTWKAGLRERPILVTIAAVEDLALARIRSGTFFTDAVSGEGKDNRLVTFTGRCQGRVAVGEASAPFAGDLELTFSSTITMFAVKVVFPFPGTGLGLPDPAGEGITATFYTYSTPTTSRPDAATTKDPFAP